MRLLVALVVLGLAAIGAHGAEDDGAEWTEDSSHYDVLGVRRSASAAEVRRAYRRASLRWHPDKHPGSAYARAAARFIRVALAYEALADEARRREYDARSGAGGSGAGGGGGGGGGNHHRAGDGRGRSDAAFWANQWSKGRDILEVHAGNTDATISREARGATVWLLLIYRSGSLQDHVAAGIVDAAVAGVREGFFGAVKMAAIMCGADVALDAQWLGGGAAATAGGPAEYCRLPTLRVLREGGEDAVPYHAGMRAAIQADLLGTLRAHAPLLGARVRRWRERLAEAKRRFGADRQRLAGTAEGRAEEAEQARAQHRKMVRGATAAGAGASGGGAAAAGERAAKEEEEEELAAARHNASVAEAVLRRGEPLFVLDVGLGHRHGGGASASASASASGMALPRRRSLPLWRADDPARAAAQFAERFFPLDHEMAGRHAAIEAALRRERARQLEVLRAEVPRRHRWLSRLELRVCGTWLQAVLGEGGFEQVPGRGGGDEGGGTAAASGEGQLPPLPPQLRAALRAARAHGGAALEALCESTVGELGEDALATAVGPAPGCRAEVLLVAAQVAAACGAAREAAGAAVPAAWRERWVAAAGRRGWMAYGSHAPDATVRVPPPPTHLVVAAALAPWLCRPLFPLLSFAFPVIVLLWLVLRSCYRCCRRRRRCCCANRRRAAGGRGTGQRLRVRGGASPDEASREEVGGEIESKKGR